VKARVYKEVTAGHSATFDEMHLGPLNIPRPGKCALITPADLRRPESFNDSAVEYAQQKEEQEEKQGPPGPWRVTNRSRGKFRGVTRASWPLAFSHVD
jgi:hypothetical protein